MDIRAGTSGFAYKEWKGSFYPEKMKPDEMLPFYAGNFRAVEINNTFYKMPAENVLQHWAEQVPAEFRFVLKASRRITHISRLKEVGDHVAYLVKTARVLGDRLGAFLFQLPPNLKKDLTRLEAFLETLPPDVRAAMEFREPSWYSDDVLEMLHARDVAFCVAETGEADDPPFAATASWGYLRLRKVEYAEEEVMAWARRVQEQSWSDAYVFFKHEDAGTGPRLARQFLSFLQPAS